MNLVINDIPASALPGQTLGRAAWLSHSHVGCLCGGRGVCQTCYVTVLDGGDLLSPLSDIEQAFLSDRQILSGGRLACQAVIEKEGTIELLSRPDEVQRLLLRHPLELFSYGATMGTDTASRILPGIANLAGRIVRCEVHPVEAAAAKEAVAFFPEQERAAIEPVVVASFVTAVVPEAVAEPVPINAEPESNKQVKPFALEGVDAAVVQKLIAAGVGSAEQLLEKGRNRNSRKELASATTIDEVTILRIVNRLDLARIKGIGRTNAELLEAAGVATLFDLAQRNASNLYSRMDAANKQKKLVPLVPFVDQLKEWISQAKKLPRIIHS